MQPPMKIGSATVLNMSVLQAAKAIVGEIESLDAALKKTKSAEECRHLVQQLRQDLIALVGNGTQSNR